MIINHLPTVLLVATAAALPTGLHRSYPTRDITNNHHGRLAARMAPQGPGTPDMPSPAAPSVAPVAFTGGVATPGGSGGPADFADGQRFQSGTSTAAKTFATSAVASGAGEIGLGQLEEEDCEDEVPATPSFATGQGVVPARGAPARPVTGQSGTSSTPSTGGVKGIGDEYEEGCEEEDPIGGSAAATGASGGSGASAAEVSGGAAPTQTHQPAGSTGQMPVAGNGTTANSSTAAGTCTQHGQWQCPGNALQVCHYVDITTLGWVALPSCPGACSDGVYIGCKGTEAAAGGAAVGSAPSAAIAVAEATGKVAGAAGAAGTNTVAVASSSAAVISSAGKDATAVAATTTPASSAVQASSASSAAALSATSSATTISAVAISALATGSALPIGAGSTPPDSFIV